jgi:hypothetical protein
MSLQAQHRIMNIDTHLYALLQLTQANYSLEFAESYTFSYQISRGKCLSWRNLYIFPLS